MSAATPDAVTAPPQATGELTSGSAAPSADIRLLGASAVAAGVLVYAAALVAVVFSRRPDALTHPQFWAEDGAFWFSDAFNDGPLRPLFAPHDGYYQTISRLTADLALPFGLSAAPLVFNLVAIAAQIGPALFFLSRRFSHVVPAIWVRGLLGLVYVALPNGEVHANVTNAQWHLAILGALVLLAAAPRSRLAKAFDIALLVLCGLSGPFIVLLVPAAAVRWFRARRRQPRGDRFPTIALGITAILGAMEMGTALLTASATRTKAPLGATPRDLASILVDRVIVPPFAGQDGNLGIYSATWPHHTAFTLLILGAAGALLAWALRRGSLELRLFLLFAGLLLLFTLIRPQIDEVNPQWPVIATTAAGDRYFLIPAIGMVVLVAWALSRLPGIAALAGAAVLAGVFANGAITHWQYMPFEDLHPERMSQQFDAAPAGTQVRIKINPEPAWYMVLDKH